MKVLLTGGNGFIATHCLDQMLSLGHTIVTTVRSTEKGQRILDAHKLPATRLSFVVVEDITAPNAFDDAVRAAPFDAVMHTSSPFHFSITDPVRDMLDPAVKGTTGILVSIHKHAPSVRSVIITSSMAAVLNFHGHPARYTDTIWNPVTRDEAITGGPGPAYCASKTFAEKAAWDFAEREKPTFTITTINPPGVFGPVLHDLSSLDGVNTSNTLLRDLIQGKCKKELPQTLPTNDWVDVREVALAHVNALTTSEAANRRFLLVAGKYSNAALAKVIWNHFPQLKDQLPEKLEDDTDPDGYSTDNGPAREILKVEFRSLEESVIDTVNSLLKI